MDEIWRSPPKLAHLPLNMAKARKNRKVQVDEKIGVSRETFR